MLMSVCVSVGLLLLVSCPAMVTGQMTQSLGWGSGGAYGRRSVESNYDDCVFDLRLLRIKYLLKRVSSLFSIPVSRKYMTCGITGVRATSMRGHLDSVCLWCET